jgi:hypothetical protein
VSQAILFGIKVVWSRRALGLLGPFNFARFEWPENFSIIFDLKLSDIHIENCVGSPEHYFIDSLENQMIAESGVFHLVIIRATAVHFTTSHLFDTFNARVIISSAPQDRPLPTPKPTICGKAFGWETGMPPFKPTALPRLKDKNRGLEPNLDVRTRPPSMSCRLVDSSSHSPLADVMTFHLLQSLQLTSWTVSFLSHSRRIALSTRHWESTPYVPSFRPHSGRTP